MKRKRFIKLVMSKGLDKWSSEFWALQALKEFNNYEKAYHEFCYPSKIIDWSWVNEIS